MALSIADFYAYSNATGVPVPEDAEGRASIAQDVIEFRRNQLKSQQQPNQESNALANIGTAALGLGALAGLGFGARALLGRRGQQIPKAPARSANAGVRQANLADMEQAVRRVAEQPAPSAEPPIPSITRMRSVMPTEEESFSQYRRQLEENIPEPTAEELKFPEATSRLYGKGYRERQAEPGYRSNVLAALDKKYPPSPEVQAARRMAAQQDLISAAARLQQDTESLTDLQKIQNPINADQFINAVESGEDQTTGRLVKNLNSGDPWGEATVPPSAINEQTPTARLLPAAAVSPREKAQEFLQSRFEELGATIPGRYRRERAMGQDPAIAEAMELYASTGDPAVLSRLSQTPSSPLTVKPQEQTELLESEVLTRMFFKPTGQGEFVDDLLEKDINLTNRISQLGLEKQNIQNQIDQIDELEPQLRFAAASEPGQGGYYTRMLNKMMFEKQSLNPESVNVDLGDAISQRDYVRMQTESLEDLGSKYNLVKRQEGVRPFYEVDPATNEPIAETLEIRSGRPSVQLEEQKTSGGRGYAMYDPGSQTGSSIGVYGVEPRNYPIADVELRPTALQREETKMTLRQGDYPEFKTSITSTPEQKRRSLQVSEALRRATIEGRDPQSVLKQFGIGI
jgi:hypothetical protein